MANPVIFDIWRRVDRLEQALCVRANHSCRRRSVRDGFALVSRLADGGVWYVLMLAFAASGERGGVIAAQMALTGLVALGLYKTLKQRFVRERPYLRHPGIELGAPPLDLYSFPSGHTLHAVCFTVVAIAHVPELALLLGPFTALVAVSRVVLGLHYPSDVAAGALLGAGVASASLAILPV